MSDISSITSAAGVPNIADAMSETGFTREGFLELLMAQIRHQDPLSPMKNEEFVGQLTQFSILEQNMNMSELMAQQVELLQNNQNSTYSNTAVALIGREVVAQGNQFNYEPGANEEIMFKTEASGPVTLQIYDTNTGLKVRDVTVSAAQGFNKFVFDGTDSYGGQLPGGIYQVKVSTAGGESSSSQQLPTYVTGFVQGVDFSGDDVYLDLEGVTVSAQGVIAVREVTEA